jgi:uncharacterized phiE125 gp8 family phage protein
VSTRLISTITEPQDQIVSLNEAKQQCRIPIDDTDADTLALLSLFIKSATRSCEQFTWRQLPSGTFEYRMDAFPQGDEAIELPKNPVSEITSIHYRNSDGAYTELDRSKYTTDIYSQPARIQPLTAWPQIQDYMDSVIITFTAGYDGTIHKMPEDLKVSILQLVGFLFNNRENVAVTEGRSLTVKELPWTTKHIWGVHSLRSFV